MTIQRTFTGAAIAATATAAAFAVLPAVDASALVPTKRDRGSLRVVAEGVPQGRSAKITVARKDFRKKVRSQGTLRNLKPGMYKVWASPIVADGGTAAVPNLPLKIKVTRRTPATLNLQYTWNPKTDVYPPGPGSGLTVTDVGPSNTSLRWTNSLAPDLQSVAVRRKQGNTAPKALDDGKVVPVAASWKHATDSGLLHNTTYSYSVFMVDSAGNASAPISTTVRTSAQAIAVALGTRHSCALLGESGISTGQVACWGANDRGQLGDASGDETSTWPRLVSLDANATQVVAGNDHTCARLRDGSAWCWGSNDHGQLGDGTTVDAPVPVRVAMPGSSPIAMIAAGGDHTCAVTSAGSARCWGANEHGQAGQRPSTMVTSAPVVPIATSVTDIATGWSHTCFVRGNVTRCLGANDDGQLGDGSDDDSWQPLVVASLGRVSSLTAGVRHTCAILQDDSLKCWGANDLGQLGIGSTSSHDTPVEVSGSYAQVASGAYHVCATTDSGQVRCWGRNQTGRIGDGTTDDRLSPTRVGLTSTVHISAGGHHSCAVGLADTYCWGSNLWGQIGDPLAGSVLRPTLVTGL